MIAEKKKEILITNPSVYFTLPLEEDPKFIVKGKVPYDQIGTFSVEKLEKQSFFGITMMVTALQATNLYVQMHLSEGRLPLRPHFVI